MDRGLVLVDETDDHRALLREAVEHARGADAGLVLLTTMTGEEFENDVEVLESVAAVEQADYGDDTVLDGAVTDMLSFVEDIVGDVGVSVVARATDDVAETVLDVAEARGCDHVFLLGKRRSPTGKALFGDVAQQVVLNFDGYVTLSTT